MQSIAQVLDNLNMGMPMEQLDTPTRIDQDYPELLILDEAPCDTIFPNGLTCDGTNRWAKRRTPSDNEPEYTFAVPCIKCDVPRMLHYCFGMLDSRPEQSIAIENGILARLKVRPERNKWNEQAITALKEIMMRPDKQKSAILMGPVGTGKTFLAQHTIKAIMAKHRKPCLYVQEHTLLPAWRFSQSKDHQATSAWGCALLGKARIVDYLLIDDFGASRRTSDGALDALEELIMVRYDAGKPVIVTTNMRPEDIETRRGSRVWSRLKGMARENVIEIKGGDFRQKVSWEDE